jgi:hypothetical protein
MKDKYIMKKEDAISRDHKFQLARLVRVRNDIDAKDRLLFDEMIIDHLYCDSGTCRVSQQVLADRFGESDRNIRRRIQRLEDHGVLTMKQTRGVANYSFNFGLLDGVREGVRPDTMLSGLDSVTEGVTSVTKPDDADAKTGQHTVRPDRTHRVSAYNPDYPEESLTPSESLSATSESPTNQDDTAEEDIAAFGCSYIDGKSSPHPSPLHPTASAEDNVHPADCHADDWDEPDNWFSDQYEVEEENGAASAPLEHDPAARRKALLKERCAFLREMSAARNGEGNRALGEIARDLELVEVKLQALRMEESSNP